MLKTLVERLMSSLFRTITVMPIVFFWWTLTSVLVMGTGQWLDWVQSFFVVRENLEFAVGYLAVVSWLFSVISFMPSAKMGGVSGSADKAVAQFKAPHVPR